MKSQTSLGRMSSPIRILKSHSDQNCLFPQNPTKKHNSVGHDTDRQKSGGFIWRKCLIVLPRSGKKSEVLDLFAKRLRMPKGSEKSFLCQSCYIWIFPNLQTNDTNPNMALLGGNPLICLTFALFFIPPKKKWMAYSDPWQMPTKKTTPQQPS